MDILLHVLKDVQGRLDHAGIASAVIGGLAVAVWGEPRLTRDVDFKVLADFLTAAGSRRCTFCRSAPSRS